MDYYSAFPFYMGYQGYGQWAQPGMVQEDRILEDLEYLQQMYPTYVSNMADRMPPKGVLTENAPWHEKEPWIRELVTVLMCSEILTRRRKNTRQNYYRF